MKQFYNLFDQTIFSNYIIKQKKLPQKKKCIFHSKVLEIQNSAL